MGYDTVFEGTFTLDREADKELQYVLNGLHNTRRVQRNVEGYGVEGEFYFDGKGFMGQDRDETVIDINTPPATQPDLWLKWELQEDLKSIAWDRNEKFYNDFAWIIYLVERVLKPRDYVLNGIVNATNEFGDIYHIEVKDNVCSKKFRHSMRVKKPNVGAWYKELVDGWNE